MAIRTVEFFVEENSITPSAFQWGGVQNEDNATTVIFTLSSALIKEGMKYRIDFNSAGAGFQPSEYLVLTDNSVSRDLPISVTRFGGNVQATLCAFLNGMTVLSKPVTLFLTSVKRNDTRFNETLSAYEQFMLKTVEEVNGVFENTKAVCDEIEEMLIKGELKGERGDDYVLTEADKNEIADIVEAMFVDVSEVGR